MTINPSTLRCTTCTTPLLKKTYSGTLDNMSALTCHACKASFPIKNGVPHFLETRAPERALLETVDGACMVAGYRRPNPLMHALRRVVSSEYFPGKSWRAAKTRTLENPGTKLILGSGVTRYPDAVHLDLDDFPGVDIVGDAHVLPFVDDVFSGLVCEVVLEHVADPKRVIAESFRVLQPGGLAFFIVPFLFPFHGHPSDFQRWSREGLAREFEGFEDVEVGIHGGPCSSMVNLLSEWGYVMSGLRFPRGYTLIKGGLTGLLFPIKFMDLLVNRFPEAHRLASTLFIIATKPQT